VLFRFFKCEAAQALAAGPALHVAAQVHREFSKGGPSERKLLKKLRIIQHQVVPGTREWERLCLLRQGFSNRDLGEDESLAVCMAELSRGRLLPFATFDHTGTADARRLGVMTLGFLDLLCWLVELGSLTFEDAGRIEELARYRNGWKRPADYSGPIEAISQATLARTREAFTAWAASPRQQA
jgi:hypothetical protein